MNVASPSETEERSYRPVNEIARSESPSKGLSREIFRRDIHEIIRSNFPRRTQYSPCYQERPKAGKVIFKGGEIMASICGDLGGQKAVS
ncbi:MAG: hypothetical protein GTO13_09410 [Proteobacteria bacterium]|nr:hypothetical protein [Pseudomonadota bacterium]